MSPICFRQNCAMVFICIHTLEEYAINVSTTTVLSVNEQHDEKEREKRESSKIPSWDFFSLLFLFSLVI